MTAPADDRLPVTKHDKDAVKRNAEAHGDIDVQKAMRERLDFQPVQRRQSGRSYTIRKAKSRY